MASQVKDPKTAMKASAPQSAEVGGEDTEGKVWTKSVQKKFQSKANSEYYDPCQDFADRSIRCLHRNGMDKSMCQDYFQAYRDCKKEWVNKRRGIRSMGFFSPIEEKSSTSKATEASAASEANSKS